MSLRYLSAKLAQQIDEELMGAAGAFSLDQLMELAGLACAQTVAKVYDTEKYNRVLVCCGPGNQGGDGLVAARHLSMFGFSPTLYMPKPGSKDIYKRLHRQCANMSIPTLPHDPPNDLATSYDLILDAIFGFSFKPPVRTPFDTLLPLLSRSKLPIVSVDIPSGWDVERGPVELTKNASGEDKQEQLDMSYLEPDVLISLTAPKEGVKGFKGRHYLGGRFVSRELEKKYQLNLPQYYGYEQIVELPPETDETTQKL
ncbi:YjeF N-terminal domain-like protein [Cantharellus anzutake]|uniref:YjeF N-terminal domain-like protein n=1 Tax=Cantharellus anzutake TaxID=1750568 RepID=UPI0019067166|nr:YjeF N-terminal domain-like protein [Cantharellus anzutake]KAF8340636.1 YjeF N-terminal domain-like protein [Cantharellus anzutake]